MTSRSRFIERLNARTVNAEGTDVRLTSGAVLRAVIVHGDHQLLRELQSEQDSPEKRPVVFIFAGDAWGVVTEGASLTVGGDVALSGGKTAAMARKYLVADPLHPKWREDVVTELVVVAYPA